MCLCVSVSPLHFRKRVQRTAAAAAAREWGGGGEEREAGRCRALGDGEGAELGEGEELILCRLDADVSAGDVVQVDRVVVVQQAGGIDDGGVDLALGGVERRHAELGGGVGVAAVDQLEVVERDGGPQVDLVALPGALGGGVVYGEAALVEVAAEVAVVAAGDRRAEAGGRAGRACPGRYWSAAAWPGRSPPSRRR